MSDPRATIAATKETQRMDIYSEETNAAGTVYVNEAGQIHIQGITHSLPLNAKEAEWFGKVLLEAAAAARKAQVR